METHEVASVVDNWELGNGGFIVTLPDGSLLGNPYDMPFRYIESDVVDEIQVILGIGWYSRDKHGDPWVPRVIYILKLGVPLAVALSERPKSQLKDIAVRWSERQSVKYPMALTFSCQRVLVSLASDVETEQSFGAGTVTLSPL